MHLGNVFCALLSWLSVKSKGGLWHLRIEDLDPQRSRRDLALQFMDDLQWLGLPWDGEVVWQSQRGDIYGHCLNKLREAGLTYPCYCTRADIMATQAPHETDGRIVYAGTCRPKARPGFPKALDIPETPNIPETLETLDIPDNPVVPNNPDRPAATRLLVPDEVISFIDGHYGKQQVNLALHCGDYILCRRDGAWAYQLAVVVDDALMGVTEVVRGRDLLLSTPQQLHLYRQLGFREPCFIHHPLLINEGGQRLCKRDKSLDLSVLREKHKSPDEIVGFLAFLAGLLPSPTPVRPQDLLPLFSWQNVPTDDITASFS